MRTLRAGLALSAAVLVAGCGGSGHAAAPVSGRAVFAAGCSRCHTISGHSDTSHQGGDLLGLSATRGQLLQFTREMPVPHPLSDRELRSVVDYVQRLELHARGH